MYISLLFIDVRIRNTTFVFSDHQLGSAHKNRQFPEASKMSERNKGDQYDLDLSWTQLHDILQHSGCVVGNYSCLIRYLAFFKEHYQQLFSPKKKQRKKQNSSSTLFYSDSKAKTKCHNSSFFLPQLDLYPLDGIPGNPK